jgi:hypothetical protein
MDPNEARSVLGLNQSSTDNDVKKAFRQVARRYHPDVNRSAEAKERYLKAQLAAEVLLGKVRPADAPATRTNPTPSFYSNPFTDLFSPMSSAQAQSGREDPMQFILRIMREEAAREERIADRKREEAERLAGLSPEEQERLARQRREEELLNFNDRRRFGL